MKPDDITDEEHATAVRAYYDDGNIETALVAQNVLRDRRVIEEARRDERERIALMLGELYERDDMALNREEADRWVALIDRVRGVGPWTPKEEQT